MAKEITLENILNIINDNIENTNITIDQLDDDLSQIGMNSIIFIQIIVSFEEEFECEFPDSKLLITEVNTVNKMFEVIKNIETEND